MCDTLSKIRNLDKKIVLAPMAGITDGKFCRKYKNLFGIVSIGAYYLDYDTQLASEKIVKRGRREFIYNLGEFGKYIQKEINEAKRSGALVSVNIRFKDISQAIPNIKIIGQYADIIELNCHCRQKEITELGIGQELLRKENNDVLKEFLVSINELDLKIPIFLKVRANFVSSNELIANLNNVRKYFDGIHIDCYYPNKDYADLEYLKAVQTNFYDKIIVGNNSIKSIHDAEEMLGYCDLVSVARCVLNNNIEWIKKYNCAKK